MSRRWLHHIRLVLLTASISTTFSYGQLAERPLTNDDIKLMTSGGIPEAVITAKIESSNTEFDTSVEALLELSGVGVHPNVLAAMTSTKKPVQASPVAPAAPSSAVVTVRHQASAAANVATNFDGTRCEGPGIFLMEGDDLKVLEPTTIAQRQGGSGVLSRVTHGVMSVKARAAIRGARAPVRIENARPKFLFCFEESQAGLSYTTSGAVNPSEFPLVTLTVNRKKRQRSFVVGKINEWTGSRAGATPEALRDIRYERIKPGVFEAEPLDELARGEYAFYFAAKLPGGMSGGSGEGGKLFPFGVD